jgi:hypothetical protein
MLGGWILNAVDREWRRVPLAQAALAHASAPQEPWPREQQQFGQPIPLFQPEEILDEHDA